MFQLGNKWANNKTFLALVSSNLNVPIARNYLSPRLTEFEVRFEVVATRHREAIVNSRRNTWPATGHFYLAVCVCVIKKLSSKRLAEALP